LTRASVELDLQRERLAAVEAERDRLARKNRRLDRLRSQQGR
jgi:hypothetical protein